MLDEKKMATLNRGRTMRVGLPVFLSYIDGELEAAISLMVGDFISGKTDFISHAAKITTLTNLKDTLLASERETEHLEGELHDTRR